MTIRVHRSFFLASLTATSNLLAHAISQASARLYSPGGRLLLLQLMTAPSPLAGALCCSNRIWTESALTLIS
jgi:hypothetical protein